MKVSTRASVGIIAATALIAPLALATSAQAAPRGGKGEARSSSQSAEAPRAARQAEAAQPRAGRAEARQQAGRSQEVRRESTRPQRTEDESGHQCDDDAAPVVQLPA